MNVYFNYVYILYKYEFEEYNVNLGNVLISIYLLLYTSFVHNLTDLKTHSFDFVSVINHFNGILECNLF